jgi:hypothetical protein
MTYMYEPPPGIPRENYRPSLHAVAISDARYRTVAPDIHCTGFTLWDAPTSVTDFADETAVMSRYYEECSELARQVTGASQAFVFDHQVRKREQGRPQLTFGRQGDGSKPAAVGRVHNDYSENSGLKRLGLVLKDPEQCLGVRRFSTVNIWRSIAGPVLDTPLAVCDARSVSVADGIVNTIRYQEREGEILLYEFSCDHEWSYYSEMNSDEALVFKQFDTQVSGVSRFTPHVAFDLPDIPADAPLRQSIEVRCLVTYD